MPSDGVWPILTDIATFIGLFIVTLSITYLVSLVSAAVSRRALAPEITIYGETGQEVVHAHWDGERLSQQLPSTIQALTSQLLQVTQQHLAYPVLHHFHAVDHRPAAPRPLRPRRRVGHPECGAAAGTPSPAGHAALAATGTGALRRDRQRQRARARGAAATNCSPLVPPIGAAPLVLGLRRPRPTGRRL